MRIEVAFAPALLPETVGRVCVVIDVLRLTSAAVTMFGRGLEEALVVSTVEEASRRANDGLLLCGERGGLRPEGFNHGNSPAEFDRLDLRGRRAVLATTNGTSALVRAAACPVVLVGSLLNLSAAARTAHAEATKRLLNVALLCAGNGVGRYFSLEDAFCAGAFVAELIRLEPGAQLWSSSKAALRLYDSYRGDAGAAFRDSDHGASLKELGFGEDLAFCAQRDRFAAVPALERRSDGLWLRAGP